jgi:hypothetical protein
VKSTPAESTQVPALGLAWNRRPRRRPRLQGKRQRKAAQRVQAVVRHGGPLEALRWMRNLARLVLRGD